MEQTAVEWFYKEISKLNVGTEAGMFIFKLLQQAKEKEREQVVNSWDSGYQDGLDEGQWENSRQYLSGEHYYDITYKTYKK